MRKLLAEAIGTFWLVLGGCGSAVLAAGYPELGIGFLEGNHQTTSLSHTNSQRTQNTATSSSMAM